AAASAARHPDTSGAAGPSPPAQRQATTPSMPNLTAEERYLSPLLPNREPTSRLLTALVNDAVFLVGALDESHPSCAVCDIILAILRPRWCAVINHPTVCEVRRVHLALLLVVVAELNGKEFESLDLIPLITSSILEGAPSHSWRHRGSA
uniref:DUF3453 domain-containing protein n=1 Tax=Macrostomum lignano TaxID=282301 RepID=A0A1I8FHQ8_9PLAT